MNKKFFYLVLAVMTITFFTACEKDEVQVNDSLVGKWLVTSEHHASDSDVIVFTEDSLVLNYFYYILVYAMPQNLRLVPPQPPYVTYSLSGNEITFTIRYYYQNWSVSETFEYVLNNNSLIIKGFSNPFSDSLELRTDVHFTRIE